MGERKCLTSGSNSLPLVARTRKKRAPFTLVVRHTRMTTPQIKIASTWILGPTTVFMVFGMSEQLPVHWLFVLIIGFSLCAYLRRHLSTDDNNVFEIMKTKSLIIVAIYYLVLSISGAYLFLRYPGIFIESTLAQTVTFILVITPFIPSLFRHEYNLYKEAGTNNA